MAAGRRRSAPDGRLHRSRRDTDGTATRVVTLHVEELDDTGDGLAFPRGRPVTVPGTLPGEVVEGVVSTSSRGASARVVRILTASPDRVRPACRHAGPCGGCTWQHVAYSAQLALKRARLAGWLRHELGNWAAQRVLEMLPSPSGPSAVDAPADASGHDRRRGSAAPAETVFDGAAGQGGSGMPALDPLAPWRFRDKAAFVFTSHGAPDGLALGHFRERSRDIVPVVECPVHSSAANRAAFALRDCLRRAGAGASDDASGRGVARYAVVRSSVASGETIATLVVTSRDDRRVSAALEAYASMRVVDGVHVNVHAGPGPYLFGPETVPIAGLAQVREEIAGAGFLTSPGAFFQTNVRAARQLVDVVIGTMPDRPARVLDLYAGAGLFALPLARGGHDVIAVEESAASIADGRASQALSGVPDSRCRFVRARVERFLQRQRGGVAAMRSGVDVVVLDPPRDGCPPDVLPRILGGLRPRTVVYVSCNPRVLARDLGAALHPRQPSSRSPYVLERVQPVDMFPHTTHIEAVAVLRRRGEA